MWHLLIIPGIIILFIYWVFSKPHNFPPGLPRLPLVGSLPFLKKTNKPHFHLAMETAGKRWNCKNGIMGFFIGTNKAIGIWDPALVREVLLKEEFQGRPDGYSFRLRSFGQVLGLFFGDGQPWVEQRRFSLRLLRDIGLLGLYKVQDIVQSEISDLLYHIKSHPKGPLEGSWLLQGNTLFTVHIVNVLWALMSGKRYSRDDQELQHLLKILNKFFRDGQSTGGFLNALPILRFIAPEMSGYTNTTNTSAAIHSFIKKSIDEHRASFNENNIQDFIDAYLLEMKQQASDKDTSFTEKQLIIVCMDFFSAGSESVSNTLSFAILYLALHPDVQTRLWEELKRELGGICCPSLDDRKRLPYLEAVILEVMRINPIAPLAVPHRATRSSTLAGYSVPKDTMIYLSLWAILHDPNKWSEPDVFRPERFIDKDGQLIRDESLIFFGAGKRQCPGNTFSKSSIFLFLGALIANFEFRLVPKDPLPSLNALPGFTSAPSPFRILAFERKIQS